MKAEFSVFETSGLDPEKCDILTLTIAYVYFEGLDSMSDPEDPERSPATDFRTYNLEIADSVDFEEGAVELHTRTGLLGQYIAAPKATWGAVGRQRQPADIRIIWAKDFMAPFLKKHAAWQNLTAYDGSAIVRMTGILRNFDTSDTLETSKEKMRAMIESIKLLLG